MDSGDGDSSSNNDSKKQLAIASMIKPMDMISREAYQANLQQIQQVKEMVRKVEMNNEAAHQRFLVDQLEQRAKDGRDAEEELARLKSQRVTSVMNNPSHAHSPELVQFASNVPTDNVELPTTATLEEVPESRSSLSYSAPAPTTNSYPPQIIPYNQHQWAVPSQTQQYHDNFRHYVPSMPSNAVRQPFQYTAPPLSRPSVDSGQTGRRTAQNVPVIGSAPAYSTGFQPRQVQQPTQSWSSYPPQPIVLSTMNPVLPAGYYVSSAGWARTAPAQGSSSTGSSNPAFHQPGFPASSIVSQPPVTTHNQSQNLPSFASTSQVQMPHQGVSLVATPPSGQPLPIQSHPQPTEFRQPPHQFQQQQPQQHPHSSQIHQKLPQRPTQQPLQPQPRQRPQLPQTLHQQPPQQPSQPQPQPQQRSPPPQTLRQQQQQPPQPALQQPQPSQTSHQQRTQQSQAQSSSQRPLQLAEANLHAPSQSTDRAHPTQLSQPTNVQEQIRISEPQLRFTKLFQAAAQRDLSHLKAVWIQARAAGISEEWIAGAIKSLPPDILQSLMAHARQSEPNADAPPMPSALQQPGPPIPTPNVTAVGTHVPPAVISLVHATPVAEQPTKPSASEGQTFPQYAAQLQYYAAQATRLALSAQVANTSTRPAENVTLTQTMPVTPNRDMSQAGANVRTPKDANKATLARDILRSLGKIVPHPHEGGGSEPTDQTDEHEGDLPCEVTVPESPSHAASPKRPADPLVSPSVNANSSSTPLARPGVPDELQCAASQSELKEEQGQDVVIDGPIMIDLTMDDSDESVDENSQEPTFPKTIACATTSSQPVSIVTKTTNHSPALESLLLEESPIDAATDDHNPDVAMHSPPLSFVAELEENIEPELLYPLPANAEPILPSFEPPPREASAHPPDGKLPLFFPSPPVSPADGKPPETDIEIIVDAGESGTSLKRHSMDVDEVENEVEIITPPRVSKRRKVAYVLIPPAPPYVRQAKLKGLAGGESVDSDLDGVGDDEEIRYSRFEQLLIEESKSRLFERRCRWSNCGAILNCATHLLSHLKNHAREEELKGVFLCQWVKCQRQFGDERERDVHLERHTIRPLPCPFAGCDEQFDKPVQVMQHEVQHQKAEQKEPLIHKPTCQPIVPAIPARLGPPPHHLPSHRVIPRRVFKCRITADRHAIVGPWVLWNIWSPVDLGTRKQNAPMRGRLTRQTINYDTDSTDPRRDDYDFLMALSSYPAENPPLDDLDSELVTDALRGLTLWGSEGAVKSGNTIEEHASVASVDAVLVPSLGREEKVIDDTSSIGQERQPTGVGEEEVVEGMLIL